VASAGAAVTTAGPGVDGDQLRQLAVRVTGLAEEVRAAGVRVATASGVRWRSVAAGGFRARLAEQTVAVRRAAVAVDDVADVLRGHARAVDAAGLRPGGR
jgi:hypothetical protein